MTTCDDLIEFSASPATISGFVELVVFSWWCAPTITIHDINHTAAATATKRDRSFLGSAMSILMTNPKLAPRGNDVVAESRATTICAQLVTARSALAHH